MKIADIIPYEHNNRKHNQTQVERIARSIKEFGFNQPIVVDEENVILVGHGRLLAAQQLGLKDVPVKVVEGLSDEQKRAYRILDNKLQNDSEWDLEAIDMELEKLLAYDFPIAEWGLDDFLSGQAEEGEIVGVEDVEKPAPAMAWAVVGVPIGEFSKVSETFQDWAKKNPHWFLELSVSD